MMLLIVMIVDYQVQMMSKIGLNGFTKQNPLPHLVCTGKEVHESDNRGAALTWLRSDTDYHFLSTY